MLTIGNLKLPSSLILSPMAGISDLPFRRLNRKFGCKMAFIEMLNARSVSYKSKRTKHMLSTDAKDKPLGVQLLGLEPKFIQRSMDVLKNYKFDILDFNAACPAKKVTRRGEGASLLKDPKKLNRLLKLVVKNSAIPVTVKIRSGWDSKTINAKDVALYAQEAGVSALFIHGRTKIQGYSGSVNYDVIRKVKKALSIPVIASGDILSAELAKKMLNETGCDGLAVARGALGNPWIFKEVEEFLKSGKMLPRPTKAKIAATMAEHLNLCVDFYGERTGVMIFRKFFTWYTKGFPKVKHLREQTNTIKTRQAMLDVIKKCQN